MKVGIISYYKFNQYIKGNDKELIYENWNEVWKEVFRLCKKNKIILEKYNQNKHLDYDKIIFIEIPRITELVKVLYSNLFKRRINTILFINETFLARARYMLRIPFLFDNVLINCEDNLNFQRL